MYLVKLRVLGGNLCLTIPRAMARELTWTHREYVTVVHDGTGTVTVVNAETHLANLKRLRAHPVTPNPRTESPTAREHRAGGPR
jgi:hypothetical protein